MASTDWCDCELPTELLNLISQRIDDELDLIRFRSVCSTWRRSSNSNHHPNSALKLPQLSYNLSDTINNINTSPFCCLFKRTIYLIKPLRHHKQHRPWLIRVTQNSHGKKLFHLLFKSFYYSHCFPRVLDFNKLSVLNLGTDFIIDHGDFNLCNYFFYNNKKREKFLAITCNGEKPMVLGISEYFPHPMLFCYLNNYWKPISDMSTKYVDICVFKGQFYLVDNTGRTVAIESDSSVQLVDNPFIPGDRKLLVESEGELLLVNIYENLKTFDVFSLDKNNKTWVKLMSLGDRVLFFVNKCSFSASALDMCVVKGNSVVFIDDTFNIYGNCVYLLDGSQQSSASDYRKCFKHVPDGLEYLSLFSAPEWIVKS
ncbi:putative F-box domain-containing protein [Medicago truncatula]|uniref:F-box protein n=1 Tax=Medicago truncatula TaxID=3880 RepID=G7IWM5_MEDTR|nr:F-box protein SKIP23 [Medicago truncatula]AES69438.1 F-box protein [Medicago truncatula]RHN66242.1 putative F-box domain-containing protein [Medicago truncatula]